MPKTRMLASAICASLAVTALAITGTGVAAGAAAPAQPARVTVAGSVAPFTSHTQVIGTVAATRHLSIQLWLQPRTAAATLYAQAVSAPGSAQFHHYLTPDAYAERFAATPAEASTVASWLRAQGFTAVSTDPQRSYVSANATASTINRAFDVQLKVYKSSAAVNAGPQPLWANNRPISLPARLAGVVLGVTGLDDAAPADTFARPATASAAACSAYYGQHVQGGLPAHFGRTSFPTQGCGYSAKQLRAAYGANMTNTGKGETIAFTEFGIEGTELLPTLQDYAKASGLPVPSSKQVSERTAGTGCSDGTSGAQRQAGPASGDAPEVQLDMEAAYAMAPGVNELVVNGLSCGGTDPYTQGLLNAVKTVLTGTGHHPLASIVSNSWTSGSEDQAASVTKIEHADLLQAAAEGVGMYVASGDGSGLSAPADDPDAIAVGGTSLGIGKTMNRLFETGWSTGLLRPQNGKWVSDGELGAAGGGPSTLWKQPAYQRGVVPAALSRSPGHIGSYRSVPDISADADTLTGMAVGVLNVVPGKKSQFTWTIGGGTSQATPLVAGLVAAAQQGMKVPFGFVNPVLYQLAGTSALHDALPLTAASPSLYRGTTCAIALCGGQELAIFDDQSNDKAAGFDGQVTLKGYDNMTGLGTPAGQSFITALRARESGGHS